MLGSESPARMRRSAAAVKSYAEDAYAELVPQEAHDDVEFKGEPSHEDDEFEQPLKAPSKKPARARKTKTTSEPQAEVDSKRPPARKAAPKKKRAALNSDEEGERDDGYNARSSQASIDDSDELELESESVASGSDDEKIAKSAKKNASKAKPVAKKNGAATKPAAKAAPKKASLTTERPKLSPAQKRIPSSLSGVVLPSGATPLRRVGLSRRALPTRPLSPVRISKS